MPTNKRVNIATYLKNVGKSVAFSTMDRISEHTEASSSFVETNQELFTDLYKNIRDYKHTLKRIQTQITSSKVYEAAEVGFEVTLDSIRTGEFYSKKREDYLTGKALGSSMSFGDDEFGDFDIGFDAGDSDDILGDFNFDDDDEELEISDGDRYVATEGDRSSMAAAGAVSETVMNAAKYQTQSQRIGTNLLYSQALITTKAMNFGFESVQKSLSEIANAQLEAAKIADENNQKFYNKQIELDESRNVMLARLVELQEKAMNIDTKEKKEREDLSFGGVVDGNNMPNLRTYGRAIRKNIADNAGMFGALSNMVGDDGNALLTMVSNPLKFISDAAVNYIIPNTIEKSLEQLDKSISGIFGSLIAKANAVRNDDDAPWFVKMLGNIFGLSNKAKGSIDTGKYNKGPVPFDGITRKSIVEVIPFYLRQIAAATSGADEVVYDYNSGKFIKARQIKDRFKSTKQSYVDSGVRDLNSEIMQNIDSVNAHFDSLEQSTKFFDDLQRIYQGIYSDGGYINTKGNRSDLAARYGTSEDNLRLFLDVLWPTTNRSTRLNLANNVMSSRSSQDSYFRDQEESGTSMYQWMFNDSDNFALKRYRDNGSLDRKSQQSVLLNTVDDRGKNIYFYLQENLRELMWQRENWNFQGGSGGKKKKKSAKQSRRDYVSPADRPNPRDIESIDLPYETTRLQASVNNNEQRNRQSYLEKVEKLMQEHPDAINMSELDSEDRSTFMSIRAAMENEQFYQQVKENLGTGTERIKQWYDKINPLGSGKDADNRREELEQMMMNTKGIFNQLRKAEGVREKLTVLKMGTSNIRDNVEKKIVDTISNADKALYTLVFGDDKEIKDSEGNPVKGFINAMIWRMQESFTKFDDWINKNILDKLREKLGIESFGDIPKKIAKDFFGLDMDEVKENIKQMWEPYKESIKEAGSSAYEAVRDAIDGVADDIGLNDYLERTKQKRDAEKAKEEEEERAANREEEIDDLISAAQSASRQTAQAIDNVLTAVSDRLSELTRSSNEQQTQEPTAEGEQQPAAEQQPASNNVLNAISERIAETPNPIQQNIAQTTEAPPISTAINNRDDDDTTTEITTHARGSRYVEKGGITAISKGEMIIPANMNPFNPERDIVDLSVQEEEETKVLDAIAKKLNLGEKVEYGDKVVFNKRATGTGDVGRTVNTDKSQTEEEVAKPFMQRVMSVFTGFAKDTGKSLGLTSGGNTNKQFEAVARDLSGSFKDHLPTLVGGGVVGGALGLLTGIMGGPLLAAAAGAAINFTRKSDSMQNLLFGEIVKDQDGHDVYDDEGKVKRVNGLLSEKMQKLLPDLAKYGIVGGLSSLVLPFGPMTGVLLGSAIAFAKNNEHIHEALFGEAADPESGLFSQNRKDWLKSRLPHVAAGTLASLFFGPFGLVGNAVLGAGLGLLSTTDEFKTTMFGPETIGPDGKPTRQGGIFGVVKMNIVDPLKDFAVDLKERGTLWVKEQIIDPVARALSPITKQLSIMVSSMFNSITDHINGMFSKILGDPLDVFVSRHLIEPLSKLVRNTVNAASKPAGWLLSRPSAMIGGIGDRLRDRQVKRGQADYMTAEERLNWRQERGIRRDDYAETDQFLSQLNEQSLEMLRHSVDQLKDRGDVEGFARGARKDSQNIVRQVHYGFNKQDEKRIMKILRTSRDERGLNRLDKVLADIDMPEEQRVALGEDIKNKWRSMTSQIDAKHQSSDAREQLTSYMSSMGLNIDFNDRKSLNNVSNLLRKEYDVRKKQVGEGTAVDTPTQIKDKVETVIEKIVDTNHILEQIRVRDNSYRSGLKSKDYAEGVDYTKAVRDETPSSEPSPTNADSINEQLQEALSKLNGGNDTSAGEELPPNASEEIKSQYEALSLGLFSRLGRSKTWTDLKDKSKSQLEDFKQYMAEQKEKDKEEAPEEERAPKKSIIDRAKETLTHFTNYGVMTFKRARDGSIDQEQTPENDRIRQRLEEDRNVQLRVANTLTGISASIGDFFKNFLFGNDKTEQEATWKTMLKYLGGGIALLAFLRPIWEWIKNFFGLDKAYDDLATAATEKIEGHVEDGGLGLSGKYGEDSLTGKLGGAAYRLLMRGGNMQGAVSRIPVIGQSRFLQTAAGTIDDTVKGARNLVNAVGRGGLKGAQIIGETTPKVVTAASTAIDATKKYAPKAVATAAELGKGLASGTVKVTKGAVNTLVPDNILNPTKAAIGSAASGINAVTEVIDSKIATPIANRMMDAKSVASAASTIKASKLTPDDMMQILAGGKNLSDDTIKRIGSELYQLSLTDPEKFAELYERGSKLNNKAMAKIVDTFSVLKQPTKIISNAIRGVDSLTKNIANIGLKATKGVTDAAANMLETSGKRMVKNSTERLIAEGVTDPSVFTKIAKAAGTWAGDIIEQTPVMNNLAEFTGKVATGSTNLVKKIPGIRGLNNVGKGLRTGALSMTENVAGKISQQVAKLFSFISSKLPKNAERGLLNLATDIGTEMAKKLGNKGAQAAAGVSSKAAAKITAGISSGGLFNVIDATTGYISGYQEASSIFGIVDGIPMDDKNMTEVTEGMKIAAGVIRALNNLITFGLLPEAFVVNLVLRHLAPALGFNVDLINRMKDASESYVDAYNAENETDFSVAQYNMEKKGEKSIFKKIGDKITNSQIFKSGKEVITKGLIPTVKKIAGKAFDFITNIGPYVIDLVGYTANVLASSMRIGFGGNEANDDAWEDATAIDEADPTAPIKKIIFYGGRGLMLLPVVAIRIIRAIGGWIGDHSKELSGTANGIGGDIAKSAGFAFSGKIDSVVRLWGEGKDETVESEGGGFGAIRFVARNAARILLTIPALVGTVIGGVKDYIMPFVSGVVDIGGMTLGYYKDIFGKFITGDLKGAVGVITAEDKEEGETGPWRGLAKGVAALASVATGVMMAPVSIVVGAIGAFNWAGSAAGWINGADEARLAKAKKQTNAIDAVKMLWTNDSGSAGEEGVGGVIGTVYRTLWKFFNTPIIIITSLFNWIGGGIGGIVDGFIEKFNSIKTAITDKIKPILEALGLDEYFNVKTYDSREQIQYADPTDKTNFADSRQVTTMTNKTDVNSQMYKDSQAIDAMSPTEKLALLNNAKTANGTGKDYYMKDPSIANIPFNSPQDTVKQTIGDSGCGPVTAAEYIGRVRGADVKIKYAADFATENGYKVPNEGTKPEYFNAIMSKYDMKADYYTNPKQIKSVLETGTPVILMGKAPKGEPYTPYGSHDHYIIATGIDKFGNIIIEDPEEKQAKTYNADKVMQYTRMGISGQTNTLTNLTSKFYKNAGIGGDSVDYKYQDLGKWSEIDAATLDKYIETVRSDSGFRGMGSAFVKAGNESGLDPRYILAHAALETGWGTSPIWNKKHNAFGIGAFDSDPMNKAYTFDDPSKGVIEGAKWIRKHYYDKGYKCLVDMQANGYCTDTEWPAKIASIMAGINKFNPNTDYVPASNSPTIDSTSSEESTDSGNDFWSGFSTHMNNMGKAMYGSMFTALTGSSDSDSTSTTDSSTDTDSSTTNKKLVGTDGVVYGTADNWWSQNLAGSSITSKFGEVRSGGKLHGGIDYGAPAGTPIYSPVDGKVSVNAYEQNGFGNYVAVSDANGYNHFFGHMKKRSEVKVGQEIKRGDQVGIVGTTGSSSGNHLHYGIRPVGKYNNIDPNKYFAENGLGKEFSPSKAPLLDPSISKTTAANLRNDKVPKRGDGVGADEARELLDEIKLQTKLLARVVANTDYIGGIVDVLQSLGASESDINRVKSAKSSQEALSAASQVIKAINNASGGDVIDTVNDADNTKKASIIVDHMRKIASA